MKTQSNRMVLALALLLAVALACNGWASSEVLGMAYVPVQHPQTGDPVVMAVPFMNSEPGAVKRALEFIGRPLHLPVMGPTMTNKTDDVNVVTVRGIALEVSVSRGDNSPLVTATLPEPRPAADEEWPLILRALRDCVHRTAEHYGVEGCRFSVREPGSASEKLLMKEHPVPQEEGRDS